MVWVQEEYGVNHGWMLQLRHWAELIALPLHNVFFFLRAALTEEQWGEQVSISFAGWCKPWLSGILVTRTIHSMSSLNTYAGNSLLLSLSRTCDRHHLNWMPQALLTSSHLKRWEVQAVSLTAARVTFLFPFIENRFFFCSHFISQLQFLLPLLP